MGRTIAVVALVAIAFAAAGCVADPPAPQKVSAIQSAEGLGPAAVPSDLHGKTVQLRYDSGSGGTVTFAGDGRTLTYVAADSGRRTVAPVAIEHLETGVFLVTWADAGSGDVFSQVQDYRTGMLTGTRSHRDDPSGAFTIEPRTGSVHLTD
ncbi:MoaF N-terminal domain-containing protein [Nocardia sp. NPDC127526]|uniref:MoaF-related domain-containing protein n=1 Tax=Nocardia sp. NPDC127526 TaxID=3345393 RepID=UPI003630EA83